MGFSAGHETGQPSSFIFKSSECFGAFQGLVLGRSFPAWPLPSSAACEAGPCRGLVGPAAARGRGTPAPPAVHLLRRGMQVCLLRAAFNPVASHHSWSATSLSESGFARVPIPSCGISLVTNNSKCKSSSFGSQQQPLEMQPLPAPPGVVMDARCVISPQFP